MEYAGANPLVPFIAPDIVTKLDITGQLNSAQACYSGKLVGNAFPNAEVFIVNSQQQAKMLLTFNTGSGPNVGPLTLYDPNTNQNMNSFPQTCFTY